MMDRHLDFTIDFETCSLSANAAVMQVAIVPWLRDNDTDPFCNENEIRPYVGYVDLRTCVVDGFDFDDATLKWWAGQSEAAKRAVTDGFPEPVTDVLVSVLDYLRDAVAKYQLDSICLWCQGPDVDIAILRNMCRRYDIDLESIVPHTSFRDCRTVILEAAACIGVRKFSTSNFRITAGELLRTPSKAYDLFLPLPERYAANREAHDALYDAMRSSWYTWLALSWING